MTDKDIRFVSPNDLHDAACRIMLEGRKPNSKRDWQLCVNFWAKNIHVAEVEACKVLGMIYECPLTEKEIAEIARFQKKAKKGK